LKFERIAPQSLASSFCPWGTLYSWEEGIWEVFFHTAYWKLKQGFGDPIQWKDNEFPPTFPDDINNLWWVNHQRNAIYLTTEAQFIYCKLVFKDVHLQEIG